MLSWLNMTFESFTIILSHEWSWMAKRPSSYAEVGRGEDGKIWGADDKLVSH